MIFPNTMKQALREGKVVFGPMVSEVRSPGIAVLLAQAGFDFFFIDMEHSCYTSETMSDMVMAARAAGIPAVVRPQSRASHEYLSRPLDCGAAGLLVPQIQSPEDARRVVRWCRYPPQGERGMALSRRHTFFEGGNPEQTMARLNDEILLALQIEHRAAIEYLPDILGTPGIDAAFVGPADLSASLGKPGRTDDPSVREAIQTVIEVAQQEGIFPGIHTSSVDTAKYWIERGMRMIGFSTDIKLIQQASKNAVRDLQALLS